MVFLKRSVPPKPRRPSPPLPPPLPPPDPQTQPTVLNPAKSNGSKSSKRKSISIGDDQNVHVNTMIKLLADAGVTLTASIPSLPPDTHKLRLKLEIKFSADSCLMDSFVNGFRFYIQNPQNLKRVLIPALIDGGLAKGDSLIRMLLLVGAIQAKIQHALFEKLPEYFDASGPSQILNDDIARLIIHQFRYLDYLVDSEGFSSKLMEILSISPLPLKKEIIGSLPDIIGDQISSAVVSSLEKLLQEDSKVIVPVLDSFSNFILNDQLREQAVTTALSCIRTVDAEHMPHLLRFLFFSANSTNVGRIISQIREQVKFVGASDQRHAKHMKLKGKSLADGTDASILDALKSSLRFKNIICDTILKELKCIDQPRNHKVIDVWFLLLIHINGGSLQKNAMKILKKKIIDGCFLEALFDQCVHGQRELVKVYFPSFLSMCECLLACKEKQAQEFGIYLYKSLFEEFSDIYSRQEVLGALVTHIGSGVSFEVSSALVTLSFLTSKYPEEMFPLSSHVSGILDYLEGFQEESLHKVYEIFCNLALSAHLHTGSMSSSIANELLMIIRKQVNNPDIQYRKMGIIGTLKIVSILGDINTANVLSLSQRPNCQEAIELLKMSIESCKTVPLPLILLYDELIVLLDSKTLHPEIMEWMCKHVGEFESRFLCDLEEGKLLPNGSSRDIEGELWMNLDGNLSPIGLNVLPQLCSSPQLCSFTMQFLPSEFLLLSAIERLTNQGSLSGIDALLGCPLHLPSIKYLLAGHWKNLTGEQKKVICFSLFYAINWIRELLNAFITQVTGKVDCLTQSTKIDTVTKLLKRLRNLVLLECLLNACLQLYPLSLPELHSIPKQVTQREKRSSEKPLYEGTSQNIKRRKKIVRWKSERSDPCDKLKQPTIIDAFKRAGVEISQEIDETNELTSKSTKSQNMETNEMGPIDISAEFKVLDAQRYKFRPLLVDCLSMLSFSEGGASCCSDPVAELPLHLYLLRDINNKIDYLNPPINQFIATCSVKASPGYCRLTPTEFMSKTRPVFPSLKKHLMSALSILSDESNTCNNHWEAYSSSAGNPVVPNVAVSKASAANFVVREILSCYSKMLTLPDLFISSNQPILIELLETFQQKDTLDQFISELDLVPTARNVEYLYCGVYSFFEGVLETVSSFSFLLATEVLFTLQSLIDSIVVLEKKSMVNGINVHMACFQKILPFLRKRLGLSAHKLLLSNWTSENDEIGGKSKGDIIQKILQIYLKSSNSPSELLNEIACSVLPKVVHSGTESTQEAIRSFPTLCPAMLLTWYRVTHEENLDILDKLVSSVVLKSRGNVKNEVVESILFKLRQAVNIVVSLVKMCKTHDKVAMHAMAVKYGGKFVDIFLKVFTFLQSHFQSHSDVILQLVKELQKATRIIQTLCSEAKGFKRTIVMNKIPATKRSMERYLFHVKALLHNTSNGESFWMGNLKHKDLYGHIVSSQMYGNGDEATEEQMEADVEEQLVSDVEELTVADVEEQSDGSEGADNVNTASVEF